MFAVMRVFALLLVAASVSAVPLVAQSGSLAGTVRSAVDNRPLAGARITVVGGPMMTTDSSGRFRFGRVKAGKQELRVRRLGYEPFARPVDVLGDRAEEYEVRMTPLPVRLTDIDVRGKKVVVPYRFEDVYRRAASGFGYLLTLEDIERRRPFYVREMLDGIPGIQVQAQRVLFRRCGGANDYSVLLEPAKVQVYVDGVRMTKFQGGASGTNVDDALSSVNVASVQAIEVYVGVAEIPAEFAGDACAVVAVWTKRY